MYAIVFDEHYLSVSDFQWNKEEKERYCLVGNSCRQKERTLYAHLNKEDANEIRGIMYTKVETFKRSTEFRDVQNEIRRLETLQKEMFVNGVKEIFNEVMEDKPHLFLGE